MHRTRRIQRQSCGGWAGGAALILLLLHQHAVAGRPLTVDDAEPVAFRQFEFEAGFGYVGEGDLRHYDIPFGVTYGVLPRLEAGLGFGGQIEERAEALGQERGVTDVGDLTLGAKWKVFAAERAWADQALAFTVKLPTASDDRGMGSGQTDFDLAWIVSKALTANWGAHLNLGHTWTGDRTTDRQDDVLHYGLALDYQVTTRLQLVAEIFADTPLTAEQETAVTVNGGTRWLVADNLVVDAAVGGGVRRAAADVVATVGLTWAFGFGNDD
jgi:hypothetical protein